MKTGIHPTYNDDIKITCECGHIVLAGSTAKEIKTEICSNCHPFYTGKQKLVDTAGRVDKFRAKMKAAEEHKASAKPEKTAKTKEEGEEKSISLSQMKKIKENKEAKKKKAEKKEEAK